ncbi:unnamed protein product [Symbiodinium sp. KB8]|nr:unnamed protein product [Symbiodinium sp. KB8]
MSEPNIAWNGEEWLLQRGEHRNRFQGQGSGRNVIGAPGSRAARQSFAADWEEASENPVFEEGEDLDEGDMPPELLMRENEAFGMQHKAKQKIAEVKKLRQYYRKPDNDAKRKALAEQMKVNPCHNCGELGHWSRECPLPPKASATHAGPKAQQAFVARARAMKPVLEEPADREWDLLLSMCSRGPQSSSDVSVGPRPAHKGHQRHDVHHVVRHVGLSMNEIEGYEVMWSVQELAFKIILDIGCMRSVAAVHWANLLVSRWKEEGRWFHVEPERETFKFGGEEVLVSRFRVSFVGSFAGRPVLYGFSIVEGNCPPLFSRAATVPALAVSIASATPRCKLCQSAEHKTRDCTTIEEVESNDEDQVKEMEHDGETRPRRAAPPPEPTPTMGSSAQSSEGYILVEAASKVRAIQKKALTGVHADYPSLSQSNEVALNLVASTASRMRTYLWKKLAWHIRIKNAVEADGDRRWKRNPRWLSMLLGKEVACLFGHFESMRQKMQARDVELDVTAVASRTRPNRGLHQRLKAGVRQAKEALAVVERIVRDPGKKLCLEIFAGHAGLSARARQADGWTAAAPVDLATGWDLTKTASQRQLSELIEKCQPASPTLSLWRPPVKEAASPLASLEVDRRGDPRGGTNVCSFGLHDPETKRPYLKKVVVESNCSPLIRYLLRGAYCTDCTHKGEEHQPIRGFCRGDGGWARRSDMAARWPDKFCSCLLRAAEHALKQVKEAGPWAVHEATCGWQCRARRCRMKGYARS